MAVCIQETVLDFASFRSKNGVWCFCWPNNNFVAYLVASRNQTFGLEAVRRGKVLDIVQHQLGCVVVGPQGS